MWSPTHIVVTVLKAKGLYIKGKNGTNNCFVTIALGKEKYQTTIKDKVLNDVDWHEECELSIPSRGNKAELILTVLHRNKLVA
uniref:CSON009368 protein n=1 Tax=Culicoides sonorensis TaxID=179676 RepID=A0A336MY45_CULSO